MWNSENERRPAWRIGHSYWLFLEATGQLAAVLRWDSRKPYVRVKAVRAAA